MMDLELYYWVSFGSGDASDDVPFTIELSDEEEAAYKRSVMLRIPIDEYDDLSDVCERAEKEADSCGEADFEDNDWMYDEDTPEEERGFQDSWSVGVRYPQAFSNFLKDDEAISTLKTLLGEGDLDEVRDYVSRCSQDYRGDYASLGVLADSIAADMGIDFHRGIEE